jgi:acetoin utilization deacetylase AcuC-like enzyme
MEGLELDNPMAERLQFHLAKISAWCCQRWSAQAEAAQEASRQAKETEDKELLPRCRIRLAYELFSLVKRLWGGEIPVRVSNIARLQEAFSAVYMHPERIPGSWEGLPLQLPAAGEQQEQQVPRLCRGPDGGFLLTAGEGAAGAPKDVTAAEVEKALGFQTVIVAPAAGGAAVAETDKEEGPGRFLEAVVAAAKDAAESKPSAEEQGKDGEGEEEEEAVEYRPIRCLLLPPQGPPAAPQFLYDCLVLVHSQDYLSRIARLSAAAATTTTITAVAKGVGGSGGAASAASAAAASGAASAASASAANTRPPSSTGLGQDNPSTQAPSPVPMDVAHSGGAGAGAGAGAGQKKASPGKGKAGSGSGSAMVVPWWDEVMHGDACAPPQVAPGAFAAAVQAAARVCKAIDLLMLADPATEAEQAGELETGHRAANAACLVECAGHVAGRYGSQGQVRESWRGREIGRGGHGVMCDLGSTISPSAPANHLTTPMSHKQEAAGGAGGGGHGLINLAVVGLMHARVAWGVRKIAVVDLDPREFGQGTDEILKGDTVAFYASVHVKPAPGGERERGRALPKDAATTTRVFCSLPRKDGAGGNGSGAFRRHVSKAVIPALETMYPELIILSLPADAAALRLAGLEAADVEWAAREIDAVARRLCVGRLVSLVASPASLVGGGEEEQEADRKVLSAHLRGLARWSKQQVGEMDMEEDEDEEEEEDDNDEEGAEGGEAAGGKNEDGRTEDKVRPGQGKGGRKRG